MVNHIWLVVYLPLWKIWKSVGMIIPYILYTYSHPLHHGLPLLSFFPITLTASLRGQPSAFCYLPKKNTQCIGEPSPLPPSQSRSPKALFFFLCFGFPFLVPLSFPNPTQNKSSKAKNKPKKTLHWRAFSPSPSQSRSPNFLCFSFLGTPPLPKPNPKQVIQHVCMFILSGVGERCWAINLNLYTICIAIWVV